eukprot:UN0300
MTAHVKHVADAKLEGTLAVSCMAPMGPAVVHYSRSSDERNLGGCESASSTALGAAPSAESLKQVDHDWRCRTTCTAACSWRPIALDCGRWLHGPAAYGFLPASKFSSTSRRIGRGVGGPPARFSLDLPVVGEHAQG